MVVVCLEGVLFGFVWFAIQYVKAGREVEITGTICWWQSAKRAAND